MSTSSVAFDIIARDRASRTIQSVGERTSKVAGFLAGIGKVGVTAFGAAAVGAGILGVKTAAANEQARIAFTTMLGSGQKAQAFLKDLQRFAATTPFEFPELQTAASSLISAGVNAKKVIPIMTTLGDVTAGMGTGAEGVQRATVALQQMNAAGKITGEDLNQLRDAGIPVYDLLAKATGKSKTQVVALAQAGKLGHKELGQMMKALETGKGLERFSGLMDKQSRSLAGMWSTLQDTLGQGMAKVIQPLMPLLKDGLGGAASLLAKVLPHVVDGVEGLVAGFTSLRPMAQRAGAALSSVFDGFSGGGSSGMVAELGKTIGAVRGFITSLLPTLKSVGGQIMGAIGPAFSQIAGVISSDLLPSFRQILPIVQPVAAFLLRMFGSALVGVIKGAGNVITGLVKIISGVFTVISSVMHGNWSKAWQGVKTIASGAMQAIKGGIQVWWNASILGTFRRGAALLTRGIWVKLWTGLRGLATRGMSALRGVAARGLQAVGRAFLGGVRAIGRFWTGLFRLLRSSAVAGWRALRSAFGSAVAAIRTVVTTFVRGVGRAFVSAMRSYVGAWRSGFTAIRGAVSAGVGRVLGIVRGIPGKVVSALGNLGSLLYNAGTSIISGLISGVSSKIGELRDKFSSITNMIPDWKGPRERDKRLLTPAGVAIMRGLVAGITKGEKPLKSTLKRVTDYIAAQGKKVQALRNSFAGSFSGFAPGPFGGAGADDYGIPYSASAIIAQQKTQAAQAAALRKNVHRLIKKGLSRSLIKQMAAAGDGGAQQIATLAKASPQQLRQLNRLDRQTHRSVTSAERQAATAVHSDAIKRARMRQDVAEGIERAMERVLRAHRGEKVEVHVHLEGRELKYSLDKHEKRQGKGGPKRPHSRR